MADPSSSRDPVEELAEEFAERHRRGERPSLTEYTEKYPQYAEAIGKLFPALLLMEQFKPAGSEATGPFRPRGEAAEGQKLERLGDYRILREVGRGGMGIVYEAVQLSLGRHVALKVLPGHALLDPRHLVRFQREAKAAARLHHTNIVPVYGVGEENGLYYYVMQFIQGLGLDEVLAELRRLRAPKGTNGDARERLVRPAKEVSAPGVAHSLLSGRFGAGPGTGEHPLPTGDAPNPVAGPLAVDVAASPGCDAPRSDSSIHLPGQSAQSTLSESGTPYWQSVARVGVQVAEALAYANNQGILHRDIKPSNLLLDTQGTVWVTDFGLAKAADSEDLTHTGDIVGTLRYMAPERFGGPCDVRSDLYALGLTLYELLTLQPAFLETDRNKLLHQVMHEEPPRPRKLNPQVPADLETIVLKATARDSAQRYQSPGELADDLKRFIDFRPIRARRVSAVEKLWRWGRRNPVVAGLTAAVGLLLVVLAFGGITAAVLYGHVAEQERDARNNAEVKDYFHSIALAHRELTDTPPNPDRAEKLLEACPPVRRGWEWHYLKRLWRTEPVVLRDPGNPGFYSVAFSNDGARVAAACGDGAVKVWDVTTGQVIFLRGHEQYVFSVAFSPTDSRRLASASADRTVRVWDLTTRREVLQPLRGYEGQAYGGAYSVTFSPDGRWLAAGSEGGTVRVWDTTTGQLIYTLPNHETRANCVAFSPDGALLASGSWRGKVRLWHLRTGRCVHTFGEFTGFVSGLAFSPDSHLLAVAYGHPAIEIWDTASARRLSTLYGHTGNVLGLAFSPVDSRRLASTGQDRTVRIWDVLRGQELLNFRGHTELCQCVAFSPDGRRLASASSDSTIRLWDATPLTGNEGQETLTFAQHTDEVWSVAISADSRHVASAGLDATVRVWDASTGQPSHSFSGFTPLVFSVAFSPDGRYLAASGIDNAESRPFILKVWDAHTGQALFPLRQPRGVHAIAFSPDSKWLALGLIDGTVKLADAIQGDKVRVVGKHDREMLHMGVGVAFRPDGRRLASVGKEGTIQVWDVAPAQQPMVNSRAWLTMLPLCEAGAAPRPLAAVVLVQLATWLERPREVLTLINGSGAPLYSIAYSPDGHRLLTGGIDGELTLWDGETGLSIRTVRGHSGGEIWAVAFSPNGRWVASAGGDATVRVWDATTMDLVNTFRGHRGPVRSMAISRDGKFLVSGSVDKTAKIWDLTGLDRKRK